MRRRLAFGFGVPIGVLGGLIGLGGAEFRLPVLVGVFGYVARRAVPLNLAVSLVTLTAALIVRSVTLNFPDVSSLRVEIVALICGTVVSAFFGAGLFHRVSEVWLERIILVLLLAIGTLLIVDAFLPEGADAIVPGETPPRIAVAVVLGLGIGMVSSMLGVAGGELLIPTFIFAFGADVKVAGTASLIVSIPTVSVGLARYARAGAFDRVDVRNTVVPMGVGSAIGAVVGGLLAGVAPTTVIKAILGLILIASGLKTFRHAARRPPAAASLPGHT